MKKCLILLFLFSLSGVCMGQELRLSTAVPPDSMWIISHSDGLHWVQRELGLLTDPADEWYDSLDAEMVHSKDWQHKCGRLNSWLIGVDAATFLRDAEFSLPYTRGYTATGFFVTPYAKHLIGKDAQMTFGVHLAGVAGSDGIRQWKPLVRLEYMPHRNVRLVMGSLYGTLTHKLFEPMLDRERYIYDHYEEGVQLLAQLPLCGWLGLTTDTWLHWEELLEPWQMTQERFTLGSINELLLWGWMRNTQQGGWLTLPFSFLGTHRGGQFSALDTCIESLFNENVGLRLNVSLARESAVAVDLPVFFYQDISPRKCQAFDKGWGVWPQVSYDFPLPTWAPDELWEDYHHHWRRRWHMLLQAGYWYGNQYIAPRGSYLFQSVSWHKKDFVAPEREMVTAKVAVENKYTDKFSLGLDAEFYYDLREQAMDLAFGVYMRYRL
ncbi:MAG: hypothetical protein IKX56_07135 [Muribaculaceae bacterium]|nr:hypothetical protein [Muribaculaceae bacterium]